MYKSDEILAWVEVPTVLKILYNCVKTNTTDKYTAYRLFKVKKRKIVACIRDARSILYANSFSVIDP